jgi:enamine deaminase RidA (YjgF/YER057c/UK114 family)
VPAPDRRFLSPDTLPRPFGSLRAIRDEYVNTEQPPASTLVEVSRLFRDDVLVEIQAVAVR